MDKIRVGMGTVEQNGLDRSNQRLGEYYGMIMKKQIFFLMNRFSGKIGSFLPLAAWLLSWLCFSWVGVGQTAEPDEILQEVDQAMGADSQIMVIRVVNRRGAKEDAPVVFTIAKKGGDRLVAMIIAPDTVQGVTAFRSGGELWLRIPNRKVEMQQEGLVRTFIGGGLFNNEDLLHLDYHTEFQARLAREDQANWYLELTPKWPWVPYAQVSMVVDKAFKLPREVTQYGPNHTLIKTIRYTQMQHFRDGPMRPSLLETTNALNPEYTSTLRYGDVQPTDIPDTLFDKTALSKIRDYFLQEK
ncbi:MAG: outer membrane lipoprotein-sorting protein [Magnetococcales bacterium]|nr:outer membrane lipoprotein-sorting protein [Magnetococcales bacterium]MBF0322410.1 outer membrane lipoprotein-sorting protein [Magnetococcales bacterium]